MRLFRPSPLTHPARALCRALTLSLLIATALWSAGTTGAADRPFYPSRVPDAGENVRHQFSASRPNCTSSATVLCLQNDRFEVEIDWRDFGGSAGSGNVVPFSSNESGNFSFFDPNNWEFLVKIVDACALDGRFWVFGASTTTVEYTLRVTDTLDGHNETYTKPLNAPPRAFADTRSFSNCSQSTVGAVYAMTDAIADNEIVVYDRLLDGTLRFNGAFSTGGHGVGDTTAPGDALGSQSPLLLSPDHRWLFAVNAGSDEITSFRVDPDGLTLVDKVPSGGLFPASLTQHGNLLYVLNAGGEGNITGFRVTGSGTLVAIPGSTRDLGAGGMNPPFFLVSPAQVGFDPWGEVLVVTVKGSNALHVFDVDNSGRPSALPVTTLSHGNTPFSFAFDPRGHLVVAEAFGAGNVGEGGASAVSSYALRPDSTLDPITGSLPDFQTASCWLVASWTQDLIYVTNNLSDTVTGLRIDRDGVLTLLEPDGVSGTTGHEPVDLALSPDGRFLYNVNAGDGTVSQFRVEADGTLTPLGVIGGLPAEEGAVGIAVR